MDLNLLEIEKGTTHKTIKMLIILIILVFIIIIGVIFMMIFKLNGIYIPFFSNNKDKEVVASVENTDKEDENITVEENNNFILPHMDAEGVQKIKNIYKGGSPENRIAYLTFDDGPTKAVTPQILDILNQNDIKATFFVLGSNVKRNPDILKREYAEGHYIANHSYSHEYSKIYTNKENVLEEYNKTEKAIKEALENEEYSSGLFRFPGGSVGGKYSEVKKEAKELLNKNNIAYLDWNALTSDAVAGTDKKGMIKSLKETVDGNDIVVILMHDAADKDETVELLPEIIKYLRDGGYQFKNIYDIIQ